MHCCGKIDCDTAVYKPAGGSASVNLVHGHTSTHKHPVMVLILKKLFLFSGYFPGLLRPPPVPGAGHPGGHPGPPPIGGVGPPGPSGAPPTRPGLIPSLPGYAGAGKI